MENILIIKAHPEPKSFVSSLSASCQNFFVEKGCSVTVRDLYQLEFNPVAGPGDFTKLSEKGKEHFQLGSEQREAFNKGNLAKDILIETEFIKKADLIFFVFPFWWSSCPAIMKGYIDRVLIHGFAFDYYTNALMQNGLLKGKKCMLLLTTGSEENLFTPQGSHKMSVEERLEHLTYGTLAFTGLNIYPSFVAHGVSPMTPKEKLGDLLKNLDNTLNNLEKTEFLYKMN